MRIGQRRTAPLAALAVLTVLPSAAAQSGSQTNGTPAPAQQTLRNPQGAPRVGGLSEHRMAVSKPVPLQSQPPDLRGEDALAQLVREAGVIFSGEVYAIRMP